MAGRTTSERAGDRARSSSVREWSSTGGWRIPGPFAGLGPRGYQRTDDRIRDEINDRLTAHGFIDATDIERQVDDGKVTLTDVYGVRDVHNDLRISSGAEKK